MLVADSDIVVMTTEILRNIMYRREDELRNPTREDRLANVGLVVLDEVHTGLDSPRLAVAADRGTCSRADLAWRRREGEGRLTW